MTARAPRLFPCQLACTHHSIGTAFFLMARSMRVTWLTDTFRLDVRCVRTHLRTLIRTYVRIYLRTCVHARVGFTDVCMPVQEEAISHYVADAPVYRRSGRLGTSHGK